MKVFALIGYHLSTAVINCSYAFYPCSKTLDKELIGIKETTESTPIEFTVKGTNYKCKLAVLVTCNDEGEVTDQL